MGSEDEISRGAFTSPPILTGPSGWIVGGARAGTRGEEEIPERAALLPSDSAGTSTTGAASAPPATGGWAGIGCEFRDWDIMPGVTVGVTVLELAAGCGGALTAGFFAVAGFAFPTEAALFAAFN